MMPLSPRFRSASASRSSAETQSCAAGAAALTLNSGGRSLISIETLGAMTVSQWQRFSSCRTLPGKS
ncbi:MAG TPA: hypothetical protein VIU37_04170, partial [Candidatus Limnocylindrales bacterium]